jgi:hypothetical protein
MFKLPYGESVLEKLEQRKIPPNDIILNPSFFDNYSF